MRQRTITIRTTSHKFRQWLDQHIARRNDDMRPRVKPPGPYKVRFFRIAPDLDSPPDSGLNRIHVWLSSHVKRKEPGGQYGPDEHKLALTLEVSEIDTGITLKIKCYDLPGMKLEEFVWVLDELGAVQPFVVDYSASREVTPQKAGTAHASETRGVTAHKNAIERLLNGETRNLNRQKWEQEYEQETGVSPDNKRSGADELYKKSVWQPFKKLKGND